MVNMNLILTILMFLATTFNNIIFCYQKHEEDLKPYKQEIDKYLHHEVVYNINYENLKKFILIYSIANYKNKKEILNIKGYRIEIERYQKFICNDSDLNEQLKYQIYYLIKIFNPNQDCIRTLNVKDLESIYNTHDELSLAFVIKDPDVPRIEFLHSKKPKEECVIL